MKRIGTQRAMALYDLDDALIDASNPDVLICNEGTVPVLVIPEADVKGCKHDSAYPVWARIGEWQFCFECGCSRCRFDYGPTDDRTGSWSRWQRPRILRVGKEAKR